MKSVLAISSLVSAALAAATPRALDEFQLVITDSASRTSELQDRALITQGDAFIVANKGDHGINFTGGDGSLGIQNGDVVYVGTDGHVDLKSTDGVASGGLTDGFTTGSNNVLEWTQGSFYACPHVSFYAQGPDTYMIYADRSGATLDTDCIQVTLTETAI